MFVSPLYTRIQFHIANTLCVCICEACERCLSMEFGVTKLIGIDFVVVLIFYSFNNVFVGSCVCGLFMRINWVA